MNIRQLSKSYGDQEVFHSFNYDFQDRSLYWIKGKNGCGKTTLLRILAGLEPYQGSVDETKHKTMVFQEDRLVMNLTVFTNLWMVMDEPKEKAKNKIKKELKKLGLEDWMDQPVATLSGGMRRRIAIIRAFLIPYDLVLLDEPLKGFDSETKEMVYQYLLEKCHGSLTLWVNHEELDFPEDSLCLDLSSDLRLQ